MSQNQAILKHLKKGRSLTPLQALRLFNCWALSSRIAELRNRDGVDIHAEIVHRNDKRYAEYSIPRKGGAKR
jgi:hypothetical protein